MKTTHFSRFLSPVAVIAAGLMMFTSCSKSSELISKVPADANLVVTVDMEQVFDNAGFTKSDGVYTLPEGVTRGMRQNIVSMDNDLLRSLKGVDLRRIVYFRIESFDVAVAAVDDSEAVEESLTKMMGASRSADGFTVFGKEGDFIIAEKDGMVWCAESLEQIKKSMKSASKKHIGTMPGITEALEADCAVTFAAKVDETLGLPQEYSGAWECGYIKLSGSELQAEMSLMDTDGKKISFGEMFGEISTDFLSYVGSDATIVAALGNIEQPTLRSLLQLYASQGGQTGRLLAQPDGTVAVAANLPVGELISDSSNPDDLLPRMMTANFFLMIHYPQSILDKILTDIRGNFTAAGVETQDAGAGMFSYNLNNIKGFIGNVDGNLVISTEKPNALSQNGLTPKFAGHRAAVWATVPSQRGGFTTDINMWLDRDCLQMRLTTEGSDKGVLQLFLENIAISELLRQGSEMWL